MLTSLHPFCAIWLHILLISLADVLSFAKITVYSRLTILGSLHRLLPPPHPRHVLPTTPSSGYSIFDQMPQSFESKPESSTSMVTMCWPSLLSVAIISLTSPPNPLSVAQ